MMLQKITLREVIASNQPRPLVTAEVDKLAASIKAIGLIQPITVKASFAMERLSPASKSSPATTALPPAALWAGPRLTHWSSRTPAICNPS
jgi:hypothetical protein